MNIIKIKDSVKLNDKMWNEHLKGKYAWWIQCRYICPLESISSSEYMTLEQSHNICPELYKKYYIVDMAEECVDLYIDFERTSQINDISNYLIANKLVPEGDFSLDELKKFRSWLAETLLEIPHEDDQRHVLAYYKNNMWDEVIKWLSLSTPTIQVPSGCGCNNISTLQISSCDPIIEYRKLMHSQMVKLFVLDYWLNKDSIIIHNIKRRIDNILSCGLNVTKALPGTGKIDCGCDNLRASNSLNCILKKFSEVLGMILDGSYKNRLNYCTQACTEWSDLVYELMYWS